MDKQLKLDRTINLNTIIALVGFLITIGGGIFLAGTLYTQQQTQNVALTETQKRQEEYNKALDADRKAARAVIDTKFDGVLQSLTKTSSIVDRLTDQVASIQAKNTETDARLNRMNESYGDKFTEIQATLANINTSVALISQAQVEMKQIITSESRPK